MAISSPEMMLVPVSVSYADVGGRPARTEVDVTEGAAADLAADSVFVADAEILRRVSLVSFLHMYALCRDDERGRSIPLSSCLLRVRPGGGRPDFSGVVVEGCLAGHSWGGVVVRFSLLREYRSV
jgi:hypothetical protein